MNRFIHLIKTYRLDLFFTATFFVAGGVLFTQVDSALRDYYMGGDARNTLIVSQSLVEHGTVRLDAYRDRLFDMRSLVEINGHLYDLYPLGTALLSAPAVSLANTLGRDMLVYEGNTWLQVRLTLLTVCLFALACHGFVRRSLPAPISAACTALFVFGTSVISTMAIALWSTNISMLCLFGMVWCAGLWWNGKRVPPAAIAACLVLAYVCRPTSAVCLVFVLGILTSRRAWGYALRFGLWSLVFLALFCWFSWSEYGLPLPPYYQLGKLSYHDLFWEGLYGLFFSPARGLFVFSPFLLVILILSIFRFHDMPGRAWVISSWLWIIGHSIMTASTHMWWGGYSYGPRMLTELLIPFLIIAIGCLRSLHRRPAAPTVRWIMITCVVITGAWSFYIHSIQGVVNVQTAHWNNVPDIDTHTELLFDWKYPQFLATEDRLRQRHAEVKSQK